MPAPPFYPVETSPEERDAICEVIKGTLYLTNWRGAEEKDKLKSMGVTHVAAVGSEFLEDEEVFIYWKRDIHDDDDQRQQMSESLVDGAAFVNKAIQGGGCVLVHCAAGVSRSATIVLAYLMLHTKRTLRESFSLVITARPGIWPNDGFMAALIEKEASVSASKKSTIDLDEYIQWGDYEDVDDDPGARAPLPRLMRVETTVTPEERLQYRSSSSLDTVSSLESTLDDMLGAEESSDRRPRRTSVNKEALKLVKNEAERSAQESRNSGPKKMSK